MGKAPTSFSERLDRARGGDRSALGRLLLPYRSWLLHQARRAWPRRLDLKQTPSDLAQAALGEAVENLPRFEGRDEPTFRGWLRGILDNLRRHGIRHWGAGKRDIAREQPLPDGSGVGDGRTPPADKLAAQEEIAWLDRALTYLEPEDRELIRLRFTDGLTFDEIAARRGQNPARLRKRASRVLERLGRGIPVLRWMSHRDWPPLQCEAVGLRYVRAWRPARVARALEVPEAAVRAWILQLPDTLRDPPEQESRHGPPTAPDARG
jgi:RNA polymerase sigma-70 factor (ECF subfamily)